MLAALAAFGCSGRDDGVPDALVELERFAFVPAGAIDGAVVAAWRWRASQDSAFLPSDGSPAPGVTNPAPLGANEALLVDMYETTRAQWLRFEVAHGAAPDPEFSTLRGTWDDSSADWPATYMTGSEAAKCAEWRGMRLMTAGEWLYCALGRQPRPYPWGSYGQASIANVLELGLERPAAVGTFESGRTPQGVADMLGNVAEWVSDREPTVGTLAGDTRVSALGGSFRNHTRPLFDIKPLSGERELLAQTLAPESRADDIGMRCCVSAAQYLWAHASSWGAGEAARVRLVALGRRWGRAALPVLDSLATRPDAPAALDALAEGARQ